MSREPIRIHRSFQTKAMRPLLLWDISRRFHRLSPRYGQVAHALRTLPPVAANVLLHRAAPRLACVKPAASVHPEPGSNSSLYNLSFFSIILWRFSLLLVGNILQYHLRYLGSFTFKDLIPSLRLPLILSPCLPRRLGLQKYCLFQFWPNILKSFFWSNTSTPW